MKLGRRDFLLSAATAGIAARAQAGDVRRSVQMLSDGWYVRQVEPGKPDVAKWAGEAAAPDKNWLRTRLPAEVHDVLFEHGLIADPHLGNNAAACAWVGEKDWVYATKFPTPPDVNQPVYLRFSGLDTLASVWLNGVAIGSFDNMFREYSAEVRRHLAPAGKDNVLLVLFASPVRFVASVRQPPEHVGQVSKTFLYLRKTFVDFGSYIGARPNFIKVGICGGVALDRPGASWIEDVRVRSELSPDYRKARLRVEVETAGAAAEVAWRLTDPAGREVARATGGASFDIDVPDAKLWWPHTHGRPNLYRLQVDLAGGLDSRTLNVGIREVKPVLEDPATGEKRFQFLVNGRPIFLQGACWAPVEGMTSCWRPERAAALLDLAGRGRMNILRMWGEGYVPPPEFYDECDRRGIFIWQDFMFGNGIYPGGYPGFNENCKAEAEQIVRKLRNHACLLLWVGGNEIHMGAEFAGVKMVAGREIFERILPEVCARLDPTRLYHPNSPYGGPAANWPLEGDWHDYTTTSFSPSASVPLFASEVMRVSPPPLATWRKVLGSEDLWPQGWDPAVRVPGRPAWPPAWEYHSTGIATWDRIGAIEQYCEPASAADLIRNLGLAHGEYLRERVERERRGVPDGAPAGNRRAWGNMVWRLNDSFPMIYSSMIDYYLEPKIPYYFLRRSYDPVLVSFERTPDRIAVWVTNDSPEPVSGELLVECLPFKGPARGEMRARVAVAPGESKRCLDLTGFGPISLREEFLRARFAGNDVTCLLAPERYLHLPAARLEARLAEGKVELATDVFARQVSFEVEDTLGAAWEDNYFDLSPGQKKSVAVVNAAGGRTLILRAVNAPPVRLRLG